MNKIMSFCILICYFIALIFGLMWYLTYQQLAAERMLSMSRMEAEGYLAIPPPTAADIKKLFTMKNELEAQVEVLEGRLAGEREEYLSLTQNVSRLQKELNNLTIQKNANEQGEKLARMLAAMRPDEAASALASLDDTVLPDVVEYALPYIEDKKFAKLMGAIAKADSERSQSLAGKIIEIIGTSLFSMELGFQEDLDGSHLSEELRRRFSNNGFILSQSATISIEKKGNRWLITDGSQTYRIRKERGKLGIYLSS